MSPLLPRAAARWTRPGEAPADAAAGAGRVKPRALLSPTEPQLTLTDLDRKRRKHSPLTSYALKHPVHLEPQPSPVLPGDLVLLILTRCQV